MSTVTSSATPVPEIPRTPMVTGRADQGTAADPVPQDQRITALDTLRGFALLGILLMNIVDFGLYREAYNNPTSAGGSTGVNLWIWAVLSVLAEGKMRCLFTLVFGASVVLLTSRREGREDAADLYYRRTLWLLVAGLAHAYLLWHGEVLYYYALCGLVLYPFRKLRPRALIMAALICVLATVGWSVMTGYQKRCEIADGKAALEKLANKVSLTDKEKSAKETWEKAAKERNPSAEDLAEDAKAWQGNFISVVKARGEVVFKWHTFAYYHQWNFDIWGMMFLGMALFKWGVLSALKSFRFYLIMAAVGYGVGIPLGIFRAAWLITADFNPAAEMYSGTLYDIQRLSVALGHLALLLILCQRGWLRWLTSRLGAIGQLALTNYVMQSILCAFVFTGYGFGLYGRLERYQLYYVVAVVWALQWLVSPIWLRHFRFGPLEWCWRALTYWKRPPFRRG